MLVISQAPNQLIVENQDGFSAIAYAVQLQNDVLFRFMVSCLNHVAWQAGWAGERNPWDDESETGESDRGGIKGKAAAFDPSGLETTYPGFW